MKRHQITLIVCGVLIAAVCGIAGWFLFTEMTAKKEAAEERDQAYQELQKIYQAKVFPSDDNITRLGEDQKILESWLVTASNQVHKGDLRVEAKTPTSFKQALQATVRKLSAHSGAVQGKIVAPGFCFGFDQYLGQSDSLPSSEHVDRLTTQLAIIEKLCEELYAANILELKSVSREVFDAVKKEEEEQDTSSRRRPSRRRGESDVQVSLDAARTESDFWTSQRFTIEFVARPAAFIEALNRLAAMEMFTVVAEAEMRKSGDLLAQFNAKKKEGAAKLAAEGALAPVDPAKLSHVERIVTDPELEPPVNVKLDIDVYSFEGV